MIKNLSHIIFDFDGVIADTFDMNWALCQSHDPIATPEDFLAHHDGNVYAEPRLHIKHDQFTDDYRNSLTPGHLKNSIEPLKRLGANYALYIVSSTSEAVIKEVLGAAGLSSLIIRVMGFETHRSKVEKFKMLMTEYGVTTDNSIFITDTLGDVKEAHHVGIQTIAETFGFHTRERLAQGEPYIIVDTWDEIEDTIKSLQSRSLVQTT